MAIKFDKPTEEELLKNMEIEESLTLCKLHYQLKGNTLFMYIPSIFPEYNKLTPKQPIYFLDVNNTIYISLEEPKIKDYIVRTLQWYGNGSGSTYIRLPIPIQLRKKYNLNKAYKVHLIKKKDNYECIFI